MPSTLRGSDNFDSNLATGTKNLVINGRKLIDQRVSGGGGTKQVIEAEMNIGGNYVLSYTGTAAATIYEFPALLADYATTIADANTNVLTQDANGSVVTTAGYYIAIEFTTTDFNNVQFEQGKVPTNLEVRHNELDLCKKYLTRLTVEHREGNVAGDYSNIPVILTVPMVSSPIVTYNVLASGSMTYYGAPTITNEFIRLDVRTDASATSNYIYGDLIANAEIFGGDTTITYKEDRWFI